MKEQLSRHWTARQRFLRDGKQMIQVLLSPQLAALRMFPGHGARRSKWGRACDFLSLGNRVEPRETEAATVQRTEKRGLNTKENPRGLQGSHLSTISAHACEEVSQVWEKNYQKGLEITEPGVHIGPGIASVPTNKTGKTSWFTKHETECAQRACLGGGEVSPILSAT